MIVLAAAGATLLVLSAAPGCSSQAQQSPPFSLPAPSFPDIVELAEKKPEEALGAIEKRAGSAIEADVLRARLLGVVGRHEESAAAWRAGGAPGPALQG